MKGTQLTIRIESKEHPACWGKPCEGEHWINCIVVDNGKMETWYEEGHYVFALLKRFILEEDVVRDGKIVEIRACNDEKEYMIQKMLSDLHSEMSLAPSKEE